MPFNQLILPLLGGYLFVTYTNFAVYWVSRQSKEQLLFVSAFIGACLLLAARLFAVLLSYSELGRHLYVWIHMLNDSIGVGTAALALLLSIFLVWWTNKAWSTTDAGFWLYGRAHLNQLESLLFLSFSGVAPLENAFQPLPIEWLLRLAASVPFLGSRLRGRLEGRELFHVVSQTDENGKIAPIPLLLTMKDRKVYVGYLERSPSSFFGNMSHVSLLVMKSGFRDKDDLHVTLIE